MNRGFGNFDAENIGVLFYFIIGVILLIIGIVKSQFNFILIGAILIITMTISLLKTYFGKENNGCYPGFGCLSAIVIFVLSVSFGETRYITKHGHKRHLYKDCPTIVNSEKVKKVTELEGFILLKFSDCKLCVERKEKEEREAERKKEENKRNRYQNALDELDKEYGIENPEFDYEDYYEKRQEIEDRYYSQ